MREFGRNFGIAFQIVDDVLDFTGSASQVGKPVGNDIRSGLVTLPTINYLEANPSDTERISKLAAGELDPDAEEELIGRIRESGAVDEAIGEASDHIDSCIVLLNEIPADRPEHLGLIELAKYVLDRSL